MYDDDGFAYNPHLQNLSVFYAHSVIGTQSSAKAFYQAIVSSTKVSFRNFNLVFFSMTLLDLG